MRSLRLAGHTFLLLSCLVGIGATGCEGAQQGYYSACDEPAGLAVGCQPGPGTDDTFTVWDACMKLATCGVILTQEGDPDPDDIDPIEQCTEQLLATTADLGNVVLACIEATSCPDLQRTDTDDGQIRNVENVIGWCGRLDPE